MNNSGLLTYNAIAGIVHAVFATAQVAYYALAKQNKYGLKSPWTYRIEEDVFPDVQSKSLQKTKRTIATITDCP